MKGGGYLHGNENGGKDKGGKDGVERESTAINKSQR
jgi:hypothetical protein